jgi:hypothetical protein
MYKKCGDLSACFEHVPFPKKVVVSIDGSGHDVVAIPRPVVKASYPRVDVLKVRGSGQVELVLPQRMSALREPARVGRKNRDRARRRERNRSGSVSPRRIGW